MEKMKLIQDILEIEWSLFNEVHNIGGRASCQDDRETFFIMRGSQFLSWNIPLLESYKKDLLAAKEMGRNPLAEKYGYMMKWTAPNEYEGIRQFLPTVSKDKQTRILRIVNIHMAWQKEIIQKYPALSRKGRRMTQGNGIDTAF
jgi:hypothetical protein